METTPQSITTTAQQNPRNTEHLKHLLAEMYKNFPQFKHEQHAPIVDVNKVADDRLTFGQKVADGVASRMGSWGFIITQATIMVFWIILNIIGWAFQWDRYPFILLNLAMSAQAAFATPLIMMSQNRQSEKDRLTAQNDYQTDCKGEEEVRHIMEHLEHQDALILQIVQQLQEQHQHIEVQHQEILAMLSKHEPAMDQEE
ncbi:MAG TPA: DUF1003 domain-containing protein [Ktedonobacteraceae bacterium]|jgi:uncharacterized membrane protein|nr:DUF1003 domain-containing protein [Ktedonobacteraceae bacterium]